jgi:hypothetical protein
MATARLRSVTASWREVRSAAAVRTVASSRSFDQGLETKSVAPRFIASTAICTPPWAVIITTTACGSRFNISPSQWKPSAALVAPRPKLASSRTTSAPLALHRRQRSSGAWKVATSSNRSRSSSRADSRMSGSSSMMMQRPNGFSRTTTLLLLLSGSDKQFPCQPSPGADRRRPDGRACGSGRGRVGSAAEKARKSRLFAPHLARLLLNDWARGFPREKDDAQVETIGGGPALDADRLALMMSARSAVRFRRRSGRRRAPPGGTNAGGRSAAGEFRFHRRPLAR